MRYFLYITPIDKQVNSSNQSVLVLKFYDVSTNRCSKGLSSISQCVCIKRSNGIISIGPQYSSLEATMATSAINLVPPIGRTPLAETYPPPSLLTSTTVQSLYSMRTQRCHASLYAQCSLFLMNDLLFLANCTGSM